MLITPLGCINATGSNHKAFYSAVENNMIFATVEKLAVQFDDSLNGEYLAVKCEQLQSCNAELRIFLLLGSMLKKLDIEKRKLDKIMFSLPDWFMQPSGHDELKRLIAQNNPKSVECEFITDFDLMQFQNTTQTCLLISVDTLVDHKHIATLGAAADIQLINGPKGLIPGEGAAALLIAPEKKPISSEQQLQSLNLTRFDGNLSEQLKQAKVTAQDTIIHAGQDSEQWQKTWYQASQVLYQNNPGQDLIHPPQMSAITGYLGNSQLLSAMNLAAAYLKQPIRVIDQIFMLIHQQQTATLYQLTRTN